MTKTFSLAVTSIGLILLVVGITTNANAPDLNDSGLLTVSAGLLITGGALASIAGLVGMARSTEPF